MGDPVRHTQKRTPSSGHWHRGQLRTVVAFDPDTHEEIRRRAKKEGTSFGEQVRLLVEWGLEADAQQGGAG